VATIVDDDISEESPEFFELMILLIPTERVFNCRDTARIQIFDDDGEYIAHFLTLDC
jgi:hypothetical protein